MRNQMLSLVAQREEEKSGERIWMRRHDLCRSCLHAHRRTGTCAKGLLSSPTAPTGERPCQAIESAERGRRLMGQCRGHLDLTGASGQR
jgi:hypothetical protein